MIIYENSGSHCTMIVGKYTLKDSHSLHLVRVTIKSGHLRAPAHFWKHIVASPTSMKWPALISGECGNIYLGVFPTSGYYAKIGGTQ